MVIGYPTRHGMVRVGSPDGHSRDLMLEAVAALQQAGVDAGTRRADINATDILAMPAYRAR